MKEIFLSNKAIKLLVAVVMFLLGYSFHSIAQTFIHPTNKKIETKKIYCDSISIEDDYRWLENLKDSSVLSWYKAQGALFTNIVNTIPLRDTINSELFRIEKLKKEIISQLTKRNGRYFFIKTLPGERVGKLYYREGENGKDLLLFDPSSYDSSKVFSVNFILPSPNGEKIAFGIAEGGSEIARIMMMDIRSNRLYKESIYPCWFGVQEWNNEGTGFYYTGHKTKDPSAPDFIYDTKLVLHFLGSDPDSDKEVFSRIHDPELPVDSVDLILAQCTTDRKYFLIFVADGSRDLDAFYAPMESMNEEKIKWKRFCVRSQKIRNYCSYNDTIYALRIEKNSNACIITTSFKHLDFDKGEVLMNDGVDITAMDRTKNYMYVQKSDGMNKTVLRYEFRSRKVQQVKPPGVGNLEVKTFGIESDECLMRYTTWIQASQLYKYDPQHNSFRISSFDRSVDVPEMRNMMAKELEIKAADGVLIPLTVIYPKALKQDGKSYCIMIGYGAYGSTIDPEFMEQIPFLLRHNILFAIAHVRGGGEKGEAWHLGGYKETKPNTWKDFNTCAEYLIKNRYTSSGKLVGESTSAGGILIGRAITDRPDLYAGVITIAGNCNVLLDEITPNGQANIQEYGSVMNKSECKALVEMDALSHVKDGVKYPVVLCTIGMNDHRVEPWATAKFVAALQNSSSSGKPVMLRVDYNNGHFTEDRSVDYKQTADIYAFIFWAIGHPDFARQK